jgi:hypothetical protein
MEAMRQSWTDERMDDLNARVDELGRRMDNGFNRVDADIRELREETKGEFAAFRLEMRERFDKIDERFDKIDERFEKMDERFQRVDARFDKMDERFEKVDARFERADERSIDRFEAMNGRLIATHRLMIQFCATTLAALLALIATQL